MKILFSLYVILLTTGLAFAEPRLRPETWARPVLSQHLNNWHQLDEKVYRSP